MTGLKYILPLVICLASLISTASVAQQQQKDLPHQYNAFHLSMEDGLPWEVSNFVVKDIKGFMWFGTQFGGLSRYDGAIFKRIIADTLKSHAIHSNVITKFVEDSLGNIWMGTKKGLARYDIIADTFSNFYPNKDTVQSESPIIPFWSTSDQIYCLEFGSRLLTYDTKTFEKKLVMTFDNPEVSHFIYYGIIDVTSNSLYLPVNGNGRDKPGGLSRISLSDQKTEIYEWPCYKNLPDHKHWGLTTLDKERNSIWINSSDGLLEFSLKSGSFNRITVVDDYVLNMTHEYGQGIDLDIKGRVWLAIDAVGIIIYDPKTKKLRRLFSDPELQNKTGSSCFQLYADRDGIVWSSHVAGQGGIHQIVPSISSVKRFSANKTVGGSLSNGVIYTITPSSEGKIWVGTHEGINIFDRETETFEVLRKSDLSGVKYPVVIPVHIDTVMKKAWLLAGRGTQGWGTSLYEMDMHTRTSRPIIFMDGGTLLDSVSILYGHLKENKGRLLAVDENRGLFEIKKGQLFAELIIPFKSGVGVWQPDEKGRIFFSSGSAALNFTYEKQNGKWIRIPHLLDSLNYTFLYYDRNTQDYWVSLNDVLIQFDKDFDELKRYDRDDGFNGAVFNMQEDNNGNLWFTNILDQIGRLNCTTGQISTLTEADGFEKQNFDWFSPLAKDVDGTLFFGSGGWVRENVGLYLVRPDMHVSAPAAVVYLRSLSINKNPFPEKGGVNSLEGFSLTYNQNSLTIETGVIDYYTRGKSRIRYKLERNGRDESWQFAPAYYSIRYDGLSPGEYKLIMQASNAGNEFNGPEKVLKFIITPPFWDTWWFRILAFLALVGLMYGIVRYRSRELISKNLLLEEKVSLRTKELKQSLHELKATQSQLIQSEKMASLGELTAGIAHEIQNPLNFVNNFSELNQELLVELKDEMEKGNLDDAKQIADNLSDNEQKVHHHGKRAQAIVTGMLEHSRARTGVKKLTDINALAEEYLRLSYHGLKNKESSFHAALQTNFDDGLGQIMVIPEDIGRVFQNLFSNAFYAVEEKTRKIKVAAVKPENETYEPLVSVTTKKGEKTVEICVKDNGTGIPDKIREKIFQPFFTTKPTGQGTGLGLSLSYDIIKAHGGELKVTSDDGAGSEFSIILPLNQT